MIEIRNYFIEKAREKGWKEYTGCGGLMCPPFTMDFDFVVDGIAYRIDLRNINCEKCLKQNNNCCPQNDCPIGYDFSKKKDIGPINEDMCDGSNCANCEHE